jgi:uracil-DNA glycosylase
MIDVFHPKQKEIEFLLEQKLIQPSSGGVGQIYKQINNYSIHSKGEIDYSKIDHLQEPYKSLLNSYGEALTTVAIDFPVFFKSSSSTAKTIMVCAMDSLPPEPDNIHWIRKNINLNKEISMWAPFSLIDDWNNPVGSMRTNIPFFKTLLSEYNLYITDIYKIFYRLKQGRGLIKSNQIPAYTSLLNKKKEHIHGSILAEEISIVQPDCIITLGNASRDALLQVNRLKNGQSQQSERWKDECQHYLWGKQIKIIASPHISGAANGTKSTVLKNPKYDHLTGEYQNEKLAKIVLNYLNFQE